MTVTVDSEHRGDTLVAQRWGPARRVTIQRSPGAPLGVSIVGGKVDIISNRDGEEGEEKAIFGIFIKNTGDRILEVDGACVRTAPHERCVQLIKAAGDVVTLTNTDSSEIEASSPPQSPAASKKSPTKSITKSITKSPVKTPSKSPVSTAEKTPQHEITITVTSEPDVVDPDEEANPEETKPIDRASAGAIKRSKEEKDADPEEEDPFGYTTSKWKDTLFTCVNFVFYFVHVYFYACLIDHNR
ncbi:putative multiple pdz domain protein [Operophtera brumata]|uniref:Putative multiple pdz domain protein n=1 Tax=Operophtera brumata TaxID=104452 RepID=A0A0L7LRB0_OPEBR|nr:putative multiple pdz domain protein [Operophtera brumata]